MGGVDGGQGEALPHRPAGALHECTTAVLTVANEMFKRNWKKSDEKKDSFDIDTAPDKIRLLEKVRQIEAEALCLVVEEIKKGKEQGHMVTHASDSTTKRGVGQFIGQVRLFLHNLFT